MDHCDAGHSSDRLAHEVLRGALATGVLACLDRLRISADGFPLWRLQTLGGTARNLRMDH